MFGALLLTESKRAAATGTANIKNNNLLNKMNVFAIQKLVPFSFYSREIRSNKNCTCCDTDISDHNF